MPHVESTVFYSHAGCLCNLLIKSLLKDSLQNKVMNWQMGDSFGIWMLSLGSISTKERKSPIAEIHNQSPICRDYCAKFWPNSQGHTMFFIQNFVQKKLVLQCHHGSCVQLVFDKLKSLNCEINKPLLIIPPIINPPSIHLRKKEHYMQMKLV